MFLSKNAPTLSGEQTGSFNTLNVGVLTATWLAGSCISTSLAGPSNAAITVGGAFGIYQLASAALPTSGGVVTGPLTVQGQFLASNARFTGNLEVLGSNITIISQEVISSNVSITNLGTGPALNVRQNGAEPVADFNDDGVSSLKIWNGGHMSLGGSPLNVASTLDDVCHYNEG